MAANSPAVDGSWNPSRAWPQSGEVTSKALKATVDESANAADRGPRDEANTEGRAEETEQPGPLLGRSDIGHGRGGNRDAGAGCTVDDAPHEEKRERARQSREQRAGRRPEEG